MTDEHLPVTFTRRTLLTRSELLGTNAAFLQYHLARSVLAHTSFEAGQGVETAVGRIRSLVDDEVCVFRGTDARYNNSNEVIQC